MSKEDFVTYEQALALKKLGFHQLCFYNYDASGNFVPNSSMGNDYESITAYDILNCFNKDNNERVDAPTLAQVQKWLRKEEGIDVHYHYGNGRRKWTYFYGARWSQPMFEEEFDSPEEALSAGITECLKLLEKKD